MSLLVDAARRQMNAAEEDLCAAGKARRVMGWSVVCGFAAAVAAIPLTMCVSGAWMSLIVAGLVVAGVMTVVWSMKSEEVERHKGRFIVAMDKLANAQMREDERVYLRGNGRFA